MTGSDIAVLLGTLITAVVGPAAVLIVTSILKHAGGGGGTKSPEPAEAISLTGPEDRFTQALDLLTRADLRALKAENAASTLRRLLLRWQSYGMRSATEIIRLGGIPEAFPREGDEDDDATSA